MGMGQDEVGMISGHGFTMCDDDAAIRSPNGGLEYKFYGKEFGMQFIV